MATVDLWGELPYSFQRRWSCFLLTVLAMEVGRDSSDGVVTRYWLDGPGI
jgi:hypothetical protein